MISPTTPWLRAEGAAALLVATILYATSGASWWLFGLLFLAPDLGMAGYFAGPRIGAMTYNLVHTYAAPALLAACGLLLAAPLAVHLALVWTAHIGFDRMLGYGLKLPAGFTATHLGPIGRPRPAA